MGKLFLLLSVQNAIHILYCKVFDRLHHQRWDGRLSKIVSHLGCFEFALGLLCERYGDDMPCGRPSKDGVPMGIVPLSLHITTTLLLERDRLEFS